MKRKLAFRVANTSRFLSRKKLHETPAIYKNDQQPW